MIDVFLIEDNDLFRKSLAAIINQSGEMTCKHAYVSCEAAIEEIRQQELLPEIILLDISLPGMNGVEGLPHFKKLLPETKIIMLTIHDDDDNIFRAICSGASGYLLKDSSSEQILTSMRDVLNGGAPMNASIAKRVVEMFKTLALPGGDYSLTAREKEILGFLVDGLNNKQIADKLFLSPHTVDSHMRHIYEKLEVHTRSGAVAKALKENLL